MMNIMMVGHRGAGKTAFMAGLYHYCGGTKQGYGVKGAYYRDSSILQQLANELSKGNYPEATDTSWESFDLTLMHNGDSVLDFKWTDHRGGILTDYRGDVGTQEQFLNAIEKSDALIVFLDGMRMIKPNDIGHLHLMTCIDRALHVAHSNKFPICFVLTKWDLVKDKPLPGLQQWNNIFGAVKSRDDLRGMFIKSSIPKDGCIAPYHCMIFCLAYGMDIYIDRSKERQQEACQRQRSHESEGPISWLFMAIEDVGVKAIREFGGNPNPSEWELAGKERDNQAWEVKKQAKLKEHSKTMRDMLKSWKVEF